jgi:DNA invertase Pin-like site-specific DNA recombinase
MSRAFVPPCEQQRTVRAMAADGVPQMQIATEIGISDVTLRRAFRLALDRAVTEANAKVAQVRFQMAISRQGAGGG